MTTTVIDRIDRSRLSPVPWGPIWHYVGDFQIVNPITPTTTIVLIEADRWMTEQDSGPVAAERR